MAFRKQLLKQKVGNVGISSSSEALTADGSTMEDDYLDSEQRFVLLCVS